MNTADPPARPPDDATGLAIRNIAAQAGEPAGWLAALHMIGARMDDMAERKLTSAVSLWGELRTMRQWVDCAINAQAIESTQESTTAHAGDHHQGGPYPVGRPKLSTVVDSQNSPAPRSSANTTS